MYLNVDFSLLTSNPFSHWNMILNEKQSEEPHDWLCSHEERKWTSVYTQKCKDWNVDEAT